MRSLSSLVVTVALTACAPAARSVRWERSAAIHGLDVDRVHEELHVAARSIRDTLARDGDQGLLRLRLRPDEVGDLFTPNAAQRISIAPTGFEPSPAERRWAVLANLAATPVVGYCARGVRMELPDGESGFARATLVVDRLLIVGHETGGYWAVWVEGLVRTPAGWRLLPTVSFTTQVGMPRRDHTDIGLWDCDVGERPL